VKNQFVGLQEIKSKEAQQLLLFPMRKFEFLANYSAALIFVSFYQEKEKGLQRLAEVRLGLGIKLRFIANLFQKKKQSIMHERLLHSNHL